MASTPLRLLFLLTFLMYISVSGCLMTGRGERGLNLNLAGKNRGGDYHCSYCSDDYKPVCASDNVTYCNSCAFMVERCQYPEKGLSSKPMKYCQGSCNYKCVGESYHPVCGYDSNAKNQKNYKSECHLSETACGNTNLTLHYYKSCEECCDVDKYNPANPSPIYDNCGGFQAEVCGSDNITYNSECDLRFKQCTDKDLHLAYEGPCMTFDEFNTTCDQEVSDKTIICDNTGNEYPNECYFKKDAFKYSRMYIQNYGYCYYDCPIPSGNNTCVSSPEESEEMVCSSNDTTLMFCQLNDMRFKPCKEKNIEVKFWDTCEVCNSAPKCISNCGNEGPTVTGCKDGKIHTFVNECQFTFLSCRTRGLKKTCG